MDQVRLRLAPGEPPKGTVVLPASDTPNHYWHLEYLEDVKVVWRMYIAVNQTEIKPTLFENKQHYLFVGVEQGVFAIDIGSGTVVGQVVDTSYVQWIEQTSRGYVLVPAEDELIVFSPHGTLLWRATFPDVIDDINEKGEQIEIKDVSEGTYRLDIATWARKSVEQKSS